MFLNQYRNILVLNNIFIIFFSIISIIHFYLNFEFISESLIIAYIIFYYLMLGAIIFNIILSIKIKEETFVTLSILQLVSIFIRNLFSVQLYFIPLFLLPILTLTLLVLAIKKYNNNDLKENSLNTQFDFNLFIEKYQNRKFIIFGTPSLILSILLLLFYFISSTFIGLIFTLVLIYLIFKQKFTSLSILLGLFIGILISTIVFLNFTNFDLLFLLFHFTFYTTGIYMFSSIFFGNLNLLFENILYIILGLLIISKYSILIIFNEKIPPLYFFLIFILLIIITLIFFTLGFFYIDSNTNFI